MWTVVPLESDGKNAVNFLGTQFQTQEAYTNILKSGPLCRHWTRNLLENAVCLPKKNGNLAQETSISESIIHI
jgi:hypothetical protein